MVRFSVGRPPSGRWFLLVLASLSVIPLLYLPNADAGIVVGGEKADEYSYTPREFASSYEALRSDLAVAATASSGGGGGDDAKCASSSGGNKLVVAAVQMSSSGAPDAHTFLDRALEAVKTAATEHNATLVLLQELFLGPYFCQSQDADLFGLAEDLGPLDDDGVGGNPFIERMRDAAREYGVVLPVSIFERRNNVHYNTVVMIDADGSVLGRYRKSHIPDGTGYQEKFYFSPGDTGFRVFPTRVGNVGVGICWDQWFPEAARAMALQGADVILYPTAIGTEPQDPTLDSSEHWRRVMQGHAAANMVPVVASNRIGTEILKHEDGSEKQRITFYGKSFITDETGAIAAEAQNSGEVDIISVEIDAETNRRTRAAWGLFRDRRPELYDVLKTKDGRAPV